MILTVSLLFFMLIACNSTPINQRMTGQEMWNELQTIITDCDQHPYNSHYIMLKNAITMTEKYQLLEAEFGSKK